MKCMFIVCTDLACQGGAGVVFTDGGYCYASSCFRVLWYNIILKGLAITGIMEIGLPTTTFRHVQNTRVTHTRLAQHEGKGRKHNQQNGLR